MKMAFFISCENGRVSRFNSGDMAGKLWPPIGHIKSLTHKIRLVPFTFSSFFRLFAFFRNYLGSGWIICSSKHKPERLIRLQAGVSPPLYQVPTNECWRHDRSFALTGLPCMLGVQCRGLTPPSVFLSPLRGFPLLHKVANSLDQTDF